MICIFSTTIGIESSRNISEAYTKQNTVTTTTARGTFGQKKRTGR